MVTVNNSDYYNNIPAGRDLNNLPNTSSAGTTVGYQYDGLTEEDRFVQKVLQEHYDKVYKENLSHSDPMAYIESKYCDVTSPNFCSYMTEDQRSIAYRNEKRMLQTGGKYSAGFARYDYALRNYKDVYTGGSRSVGYVRNTDREKQHARSVVNQQISNLLSKNGISISKQADLVFSIDPYTYQLTVSGNADRDTLSQIEKLLNEGDNAKNIWTHAWICMHDADNEIVNSQANMTKANQYSLWHEVYETTGYDARNATYKNGTFIAEDGTDLLALFKEKSKNGAGYELYSKRWLEYAKNGWKKENDLVLKIGFFAVAFTDKSGQTSVKYTRDGAFKVNADGYLVTADGDHVLNATGALSGDGGEANWVRVDPNEKFSVNSLGYITQNNQLVGTVGVVDVDNYDYIEKYGENLYNLTAGGNIIASDAEIEQGALETSNVNVVNEMVNMITIQRAYEAGQKVITSIDETLDKAVNNVGRV